MDVPTCPDCGNPWTVEREDRCPTCGLSVEDIESAAAFYGLGQAFGASSEGS